MTIEELLIELVKQHDVLYDTKSFNYKDHYVRQQAWEEIGRELKITGEVAKKSWNTLRRCFLNAISRRRKKSETFRKSIPWKYELQMSFLLPFIDTSKSQSFKQEEADRDNVLAKELKYNITNGERSANLELSNVISQEQSSHSVQIVRGSRREVCDNSVSSAVTTVKEATFRRKPRCEEWQSREMDETDMFFFSMAKMTKRLPLLEQAKIKLQLSNAVLQAQIKVSESMQQERPPSACSASSSTSANFVQYDPNISIQAQQ